MLASAVRIVSTPELVGVHAKGGRKRFRDLLAVRHADDGGGSGKRSLGNTEERGRAFIPLEKNGLTNLFGFIAVSSLHEARSR